MLGQVIEKKNHVHTIRVGFNMSGWTHAVLNRYGNMEIHADKFNHYKLINIVSLSPWSG